MEKKKKISIIVLVITLILIITISTTALWKWTSGNSNVGFTISGLDAYIIYNKGSDVLTGVLDPVSSYSQTGVSTEITLYKNTNKTLYGHIYLDVTSIGTNIANEPAVKWVITSNGQVLNEGNFVGSSVDTSIPLKINIPLSQTEQKFQIYIWLDEGMDINKAIEGESLSTIVRAEASEVEYVMPGIDNSGANYPDLVEGMIPVMYDGSKWVKADTKSSSSTYGWYDYDTKKWANAVLVSNTNRSLYKSATPGTPIPESEVLAYYVWIPRYKYKVWNINKVIGTDSYNAQTTGIDIVFESGTSTTGTISCNNYSFANTSYNENSPNETCSGTNGDYYNHPAFWWDMNGDNIRSESEELNGVWIGKFEISSSTPNTDYGGGYTIELPVRTKPNVNIWRTNTIDNFSLVIQNMQINNNEFGLSSDKTKTDSHMIKNIEWGAVAYLTNSNYGRCVEGKCEEVALNSYYNGSYETGFKTGCGPQSTTSTSSGSTCNEYNSDLGQLSSTTGNVYGIYDMSGATEEYVMGNMSSNSASYIYYPSGVGSNFSYSTETSKYIDTYAYGTDQDNQSAYNRARLGDATGEVISTTSGGWNGDKTGFLRNNYSWFSRGGRYSYGTESGIYAFYGYVGSNSMWLSTRIALVAPQK